MKIEKLPSGSYRVRQQSKGKKYSIVFDHKPTAREINQALSEKMAIEETRTGEEGTLFYYGNKYLDKCRKSRISPSTIIGYDSKIRTTPAWFLDTDIRELTEAMFQKCVDEYSVDRSPKTVRNMYSVWRSVLAEYRPLFTYSIKLPKPSKKAGYEPTTKDVKAILDYANGSRYYTALRLASIGLRRGEICALTAADIDADNILTISKDMILDENNNQVIKNTPKTDASYRRILIPGDIADMIRTDGYAFDGNMHTINEYLHKAQDALGIHRFRLHILRHFAAAYLLKKKQFSVVEIEDYMGWEHGSSTMQKVYAYNLDPQDTQKDIANAFADLS